jgi:hypothetical protein
MEPSLKSINDDITVFLFDWVFRDSAIKSFIFGEAVVLQ